MPTFAQITVHASQFPDAVRRDLLESLRSRQVSHKFHYDSIKQTNQWLALHQTYSPSRTDADCAGIYDRCFEAAAKCVSAERLHLIGLGCGGGQKDARLLRLLKAGGRQVSYTPSDVSSAMVLVAWREALEVIPPESCQPLVCDLATATDLPTLLDASIPSDASRLITFFGMIPNFEPDDILPKLSSLVRPGDYLLFSANLAPGDDYELGVRHVLPLYDNASTRAWLMTFLSDLGIKPGDGEMEFVIEKDNGASGLLRIAAYFRFTHERTLAVGEETFRFTPGDRIRLFYSYRHTPALVRTLLSGQGLQVCEEWIAASGEEGVFLTRRNC